MPQHPHARGQEIGGIGVVVHHEDPQRVRPRRGLLARGRSLDGRRPIVRRRGGQPHDEFAPLAPKIKEALKTITNKPIKFIINTHYHGDHTGGNAIFQHDAPILAHDNVRTRLAAGSKALGQETPPAPKDALPVITFNDRATIHVNGEDIQAVHFPHGHTDGDAFIVFPAVRAMCIGDLMAWNMAPLIDPAAGGSIIALPDTEFHAELEQRFGLKLGDIEAVGPRRAHPLGLSMARSFIEERLALIGDAAHVIHPIAGQGLNLGLRDVAALAEAIVDAARLGLDPGAPDVLERYQRWRRFDTMAMGLATNSLNFLFSNHSTLLRTVRDIGLGLVDRAPPLKSMFIRQAAGLSGEVPRLLKGEAL